MDTKELHGLIKNLTEKQLIAVLEELNIALDDQKRASQAVGAAPNINQVNYDTLLRRMIIEKTHPE